jgi:hypothetical protein
MYARLRGQLDWKSEIERRLSERNGTEWVEPPRGLLEAQWAYIASLEGFDPDTGDYLDGSGPAQLSLGR